MSNNLSENNFLDILEGLASTKAQDAPDLSEFENLPPLDTLSQEELREAIQKRLGLNNDQVARLLRLAGLEATGPSLARLASAGIKVAEEVDQHLPQGGASSDHQGALLPKGKGKGKRSVPLPETIAEVSD